MAGKRQHYIPRLLQRGFLADPSSFLVGSDDAERTWLHRPGIHAKLTSIRDIGTEGWFYSRKSADGQPTLDDAITDYERDLSSCVKTLREAEPGTTIAPHLAAETVVHLVLRTAHLRSLMSSGVSRLISEVEALFTDPLRLGSIIGLTGPTLHEATIKAIRDTAAELVPAGIPSAFSERLMAFMLRELGDQVVLNAVRMLPPLIEKMLGDVDAGIREIHNKLLTRPIADNGWVAALAQFVWTIESGEGFILPDAVALSRAAGGQLAPLLFTAAVDVEIVVMPVASDRILVGRRNNAMFDPATFNNDAAAASESFFIAARPLDESALIERIGTGPAETVKRAIADAISEAEQTRQLPVCDIPPVQPEERVQQDFSYSVRLADFGDAALAKEIADIVQAVVAHLARDMPLQDLDGLTIAVNYDDALASLDRGDPSLPPATSNALGYARGVMKQVTVRRDGTRKEHLIVAAWIAETWRSPDPDARAFGLHSLVTMLAGIAHASRYANALGVGFKPDPIARELHLAVAKAPSGYWNARQAAFIAPNVGATYADLVIECLDYAEREIAAERAQMTDPSDIQRTTMRALECVSAVLVHAADWLGHRDGLSEGEVFTGSDLPERLQVRGLDRWINMFGRDLAACYGPEGTLELSVLTTLSRHVERLLWSLGLYCWPESEAMRVIVSDQLFRPPPLPINAWRDVGSSRFPPPSERANSS